MGFGLALAVPYILSQTVVPFFVTSPSIKVLIARRIYPFLLLACLCGGAGAFQVNPRTILSLKSLFLFQVQNQIV